MTSADRHPPDPTSGDILIAGLGSIGRRHLANLQTLGWSAIRLYRTGWSTLPAASLSGHPTHTDLDQALAHRPIAAIVSNPSALHVPVALAAARAGTHLLIEKPLSHDDEGIDELITTVTSRGLTALVGFHFRFSPGLRRLKEWIDTGSLGDVLSVQVHWGEYLPDMHPWEDYRAGYAASEALGGGVLNTLCHPFDYLRWMLGEVSEVKAFETRPPSFGLAVDTCVEVALAFESGAIGHVHLDFVQRPREHRLLVIGSAGTAGWSDADHGVWRRSGLGPVEYVMAPSGFDRNEMFLDEMRHFLACIRGDASPICTLADGRAVVQIVSAARREMRERLARGLEATCER